MSEGTLYPALKRLERKGLLASYWGQEPAMSGRRKYYQITESGIKKLDQHLAEWNKINKLMQLCIGGTV